MIPPSFDVVRISQQCTAVIAGRAEPGARVTVWDGDRPLGQVEADRRGEWVLVVGEPLRSGSRQLKLVAVGASEASGPGALVRTLALDQMLGDLAVALEQDEGQKLGGKSAEAARFILRAIGRELDNA